MSVRVFLVLIFILLCKSAFSTKTEIDSLNKRLAISKEDTSKVNTLLALSKYYFSIDPSISINWANRAKSLSEKLNYKKGIGKALKNIGIAWYNQGNYMLALQNWQFALSFFDSIGDRVGISNMYSNIGAIYQVQGDDDKALESHLKSLKVAESINDSTRIMTSLINIGAVYYNKPLNYGKALESYLKALPISEALEDNDAIGTVTVNIGEIYFKRGDDTTALKYFEQSYKAYGENSESAPYSLNDIGSVYEKRRDFAKAIKYHTLAYDKAKILDAGMDMAISLKLLAETYRKKLEFKTAIQFYLKALELAKTINANNELKEIYEAIAYSFAELHDYAHAFQYLTLMNGIKDTLYNAATSAKLKNLLYGFEFEKKKVQLDLLEKDAVIQHQELRRQKLLRNGSLILFFLIIILLIILISAISFYTQRNKIRKGKKLSDELLLNILPAETAEELKLTGTAEAKSYDMVTVMFTDFKNFTQVSEKMTPQELVKEINHCYVAFDNIISRYGIEKIKTLGDGYMCAGGLPVKNMSNPIDAINSAMEIQSFMAILKKERSLSEKPYFETRIGIHTGPVVAGIVGIKKFAYDIWGDTVNIASRMESSGEAGRINISGSTYELVKDKFKCIHRGKIDAKNKGVIDMYFVDEAI